MTERDPVLEAVDLLAPALERAGLDELELEIGEIRVRLARPPAPAAAGPPHTSTDGLTPFGEPRPGMRFVAAPLTGVWYPAPSPGARPYLNEGDQVAAGQVVGLIEAMKLFNEIKADVTGIVSRILVESGTLVKRKQPLLEIDPT